MQFPYRGLTKDQIQSLLYKYIEISLDNLYKNDLKLISMLARTTEGDLLEKHAGERAIVFRFGLYFNALLCMDKLFNRFDLDCEYNRHGFDPKEMMLNERFIPDMILHKRRCDSHNLLVIEFKTHWNNDTKNDKKKLIWMTSPDKKFQYLLGLSIIIGKSRDEVIEEWVIKGEVLGNRGNFRIQKKACRKARL